MGPPSPAVIPSSSVPSPRRIVEPRTPTASATGQPWGRECAIHQAYAAQTRQQRDPARRPRFDCCDICPQPACCGHTAYPCDRFRGRDRTVRRHLAGDVWLSGNGIHARRAVADGGPARQGTLPPKRETRATKRCRRRRTPRRGDGAADPRDSRHRNGAAIPAEREPPEWCRRHCTTSPRERCHSPVSARITGRCRRPDRTRVIGTVPPTRQNARHLERCAEHRKNPNHGNRSADTGPRARRSVPPTRDPELPGTVRPTGRT
jgi:hypothetical protein